MGTKIKNPKTKKVQKVAAFVAAPLFLAAGLVPFIYPDVDAASSAATTKINVTIQPVISITVPKEIDINITPTDAGVTGTGTGKINVVTNDAKGYTLTLTDYDNSTTLNHADTAVSTKFSTISAASATLGKNTWGWKSGDANFHPVLPKSTAISNASTSADLVVKKTSAPAAAGENVSLTIGANATSSMVSGTYSDVILLTAFTN